jgi:hypothetical protein
MRKGALLPRLPPAHCPIVMTLCTCPSAAPASTYSVATTTSLPRSRPRLLGSGFHVGQMVCGLAILFLRKEKTTCFTFLFNQ